MSNPKDGGSAFPSHGTMGEVVSGGMSLRDYFAIHATEEDIAWVKRTLLNCMPASRIEARWAFADAMLAERSKPHE